MRRQQSGFTLVEIAIVLVIIGLLLGGVLKGQELINSAKVKNMANDFRNIATFVYAYQDKFRALPGDDAAVVNHVAGTLATTPAASQGNARINGNWNSTTATDESFLFWQHVRLAALATGTSDTASVDYVPRNAEGGRIGITSDAIAPNANFPGGFYICSEMQGRYARQLDATIDDGDTTTGTMRVIGPGGTVSTADATGAGVFAASLTPANDGTTYTVCMGN
ncbi:MAG: prepilin-type N-terminal cleavage/methylation domain-containing protein [Gammaproteobacteria bacterium]|nr:prepilin-type N-terminal cleavage/methylation domain-containing protein [Gammaproteobacteria bacterium]MBU1415851.1 prepilin-type N-terminal cleavage/methylation domain-containing protein [Gammaproteobacteria bacterium]